MQFNMYPIRLKLSVSVVWQSAILIPLHDEGGVKEYYAGTDIGSKILGIFSVICD